MAIIHWKTAISGAFGDAADWGGGVPGVADDAILDAAGAAFTVTASHDHTVNSVQTAANATLAITGSAFTATNGTGAGANAGTLAIGGHASLVVGGSVDNSGGIDLGGRSGAPAALVIAANATLSGGGQVSLSDSLRNYITGASSGAATLTNFDNVLSGAGVVGGSGLSLVNAAAGVIDANGALRPLIVDAAMTTNAGLIEATGAGGLQIEGAVANSGTIEATGAAYVTFRSGSVVNSGLIAGGGVLIQGATIDDTHGGQITPLSKVTLSDGVVLGGSLAVNVGGVMTVAGYANVLATETLSNAGAIDVLHSLQVQGDIVNSGEIDLNGSANHSAYLVFAQRNGTTSLTGGGAITLSDSSRNYVYTTGGVGLFNITNVDNTISGAGTIGDFDSRLSNEKAGIIDADGTNALTLRNGRAAVINGGLIETTGAGGLKLDAGVFNYGTIEAVGAGALTVVGYTITNSGGGVIEATGSGSLVLSSATVNDTQGGVIAPVSHLTLQRGRILGGTLTIGAGGTMKAIGSANVLTTSTLTNQGAIDIGGGASLQVQGAVVNSGEIDLDARPTAAASLLLGANTTLTGGGSLTLSDNAGNAILAVGAARFVNVDNTISGAGTIGNIGLTLVNETAGVIDADGAGSLVIRTFADTIANGGLIEATSKGLLQIDGAVANAGRIEALGSGTLDLAGAVAGSGSMSVGSGATLEADSTVASTGSLSFAGPDATLALKDPAAFKATIAGFDPADAIELLGFKATSAVLNGADQLVITNGGAAVATLQLTGNYVGDTFTTTFAGGRTTITVSAGAEAPGGASAAAAQTASSARILPFVGAMAGLTKAGGAASASLDHGGSEAPRLLTAPRTQVA